MVVYVIKILVIHIIMAHLLDSQWHYKHTIVTSMLILTSFTYLNK